MKKEKEEIKFEKEIKEGMEKNKNEIIDLIKNYFEKKKKKNKERIFQWQLKKFILI